MKNILIKSYKYFRIDAEDWTWLQLIFGRYYIGLLLIAVLVSLFEGVTRQVLAMIVMLSAWTCALEAAYRFGMHYEKKRQEKKNEKHT